MRASHHALIGGEREDFPPATCPATHGVLWLALYHSGSRPFSPRLYPMFWMRLSTGNSSRRVRRYWDLILQVKHFGLPMHQFAKGVVREEVAALAQS